MTEEIARTSDEKAGSIGTGYWVAWLCFPLVMAAAMFAHVLLLEAGVGLEFATYLPVLAGAIIVTLLERHFPHKENWAPTSADVAVDAWYMVFIQLLLPLFLGFFFTVTLLDILRSENIALTGLWPHDWPFFVQALLMFLIADFLRYWLHRLSHNWEPLWRMHAVHHSPHKLYWLNVGRFHIFEKILHYMIGELPFLAVGVTPELLAVNFVLYAVNGFFQHCNIEMRLGVLNYIFAGPELHRWHHSKLIVESNNNYGNTLIIWDLLFASWFLPKERDVGDLGLYNRRYPMSFLAQQKAPFIKGLDKQA